MDALREIFGPNFLLWNTVYMSLLIGLTCPLVGVYLVFSSLIIPALATRTHHGSRRYIIAYGVGAIGYALGLALSALFDLPSGAVIVWALAACAALGALSMRPTAHAR